MFILPNISEPSTFEGVWRKTIFMFIPFKVFLSVVKKLFYNILINWLYGDFENILLDKQYTTNVAFLWQGLKYLLA